MSESTRRLLLRLKTGDTLDIRVKAYDPPLDAFDGYLSFAPVESDVEYRFFNLDTISYFDLYPVDE